MMSETELENLVVRVTGDATSYQRMAAQAASATQELGKTISQETGKAEVFGKTIDNLGTQMSGFAGQMRALTALESPMSVLTGGVQLSARAESMAGAFKTLVGSAELANSTLKDLQRFAAETPFEMPEVVAASKQMIAFGQSAEEIVPTMRMLGDVSSGLQIPLSQLIYLYGTLKSSQRVTTTDMNQFAMRGIPIWTQLEKQLGKTNSEVREMVTDRSLTFDMIEEAFRQMTGEGGKFNNMMKEQSQLTEGLYSTMGDEIGQAKKAIGDATVEMLRLKDGMKAVTQGAMEFKEWFESLSGTAKAVMAAFAIFVMSIGAAVVVWKVGAITVGILVGVFKDMAISVPWATKATWEWVIALGAQTRAVQVAIPANSAYSVQNFYTAGAIDSVTAATVANTGATVTMTKTNWAAVASARALHLTLAAAALYGVLELARSATGGNAEMEKFTKSMEVAKSKYQEMMKSAKSENDRLLDDITTKRRPADREIGLKSEAEKQKKIVDDLTSYIKEEQESFDKNFGIGNRIARNMPWGDEALKNYTNAKTALDQLNQSLDHHKKYAMEIAAKQKEFKVPGADPGTLAAIKELEDALEKQVITFKMSKDQIALYELKVMGATDAQLSAVKSLQAMIKEQLKLKEVWDASDDEFFKQIERGVEITRSVMNPTEVYTEAVAELDHLLWTGSITQETYNRALLAAKQNLNGVADGARAAFNEVSRFNAVLTGSTESRINMMNYLRGMTTGRAGSPATAGVSNVIRAGVFGDVNRNGDRVLKDLSDTTRRLADGILVVADAIL